jgi:hypothetical protein
MGLTALLALAQLVWECHQMLVQTAMKLELG